MKLVGRYALASGTVSLPVLSLGNVDTFVQVGRSPWLRWFVGKFKKNCSTFVADTVSISICTYNVLIMRLYWSYKFQKWPISFILDL